MRAFLPFFTLLLCGAPLISLALLPSPVFIGLLSVAAKAPSHFFVSLSQAIRADPWGLPCSFPCGSGAEFKQAGQGWLSELPNPGAGRWKCQEPVGCRDHTACGCVTPCCPILCIQPGQHSRFQVSVFASLPAAFQKRSMVPLYLGA